MPPASGTSTESVPSRTASREPHTTRLKTSRPKSSVPKRCAADGARRRSRTLIAIGSCGAMSGAKEARSRRPPKSAKPRTIGGDRRARPTKAANAPGRRSIAAGSLGVADTRIEPRIQHVHREIHEHEGDGAHQDGALDEREIAIEDRLRRETPDPRPAEDVLDDVRATKERAELEADDRRDRDERVLQRVPQDDHALPQALRP